MGRYVVESAPESVRGDRTPEDFRDLLLIPSPLSPRFPALLLWGVYTDPCEATGRKTPLMMGYLNGALNFYFRREERTSLSPSIIYLSFSPFTPRLS